MSIATTAKKSAKANAKRRRSASQAEANRKRPVSDSKPRLRALRDRLEIPQATMARLLDVSVRTISTLESKKSSGKKTPRNVIEMERLLNALAEIMRADHIATWLEEENESFDGLKPLEVIERGEQDRIWQMIHFIASGEPA